MAHRFRLSPTTGQVEMLAGHCADARAIWNLGVEQHRFAMRHRCAPHDDFAPASKARTSWPTAKERSTQLGEMRQAGFLADGSAVVQQQALRDLNQAFQNHFARPEMFGWPSFRSKKNGGGFRVMQLERGRLRKINRKWAELNVPKVGWVRFRLSRPWCQIAVAKSARVTLNKAGQWHVTFPGPQPVVASTGTEAIGLDVGVAKSVTSSSGEHWSVPTTKHPRLLRLQRKRSRQQPGSNRRKATNIAIAKAEDRQARVAKDFIEKLTTTLVAQSSFIAIEDLNIANMTKSGRGKRGLNRSILEQRWGQFRTRLEQKAAASGVTVVAVPAANTSRRCAACGHVAKENRESQAAFWCKACGHKANADVNAAITILAAGQAVTGRGGPPAGAPCEASTTRPQRSPLRQPGIPVR